MRGPSALRKQFVRDRRPIPVRRAVNGPDVRAAKGNEPCVIRSRAALAGVKSCRGSCQLPLQAKSLISFHLRYDLRARRRCWPWPRCRSLTRWCHSCCRRSGCRSSGCSCRRRGRRRGRCRTPTARGYVVHTQAWCQGGFIARERREVS